jgi:hypothetical protein
MRMMGRMSAPAGSFCRVYARAAVNRMLLNDLLMEVEDRPRMARPLTFDGQ